MYMEAEVPRYSKRIEELNISLENRLSQMLEMRKIKLTGMGNRLNDLSPLNILRRGYSITLDKQSSRVIKDSRNVRRGVRIETRLCRGSLESVVRETKDR